ncbi:MULTISPECIES: DUF192 domain-containing protein [unclassified Agarivorans]|uniref:DUF192 domain-containing protein n=1 Tax=unclassified Agarivorans TaxID=2636026 RepID=UPI0026E460CC|nr:MULTISPECIES: DUF192 domain-containing protein [unclassified Agarivorans]MDO6686478.1 DUF192 domain-containing protein [Agarivorans sp. 3_MG-2023]MDO6715296.1 DUF192 domain-containing protein [Agarivorans sp. 2_MG-2023]
MGIGKPSHWVFLLGLLLSVYARAAPEQVMFSSVEIRTKQQVYVLEYAYSAEQRARGLMYRQSLCDDCGMLFNFQQPKRAGLWMKNTYLPLDVAFIRQDGRISEIRSMQAHDVRLTVAKQNILYAWEMNQGWFSKNAIQVGDMASIKPLE